MYSTGGELINTPVTKGLPSKISRDSFRCQIVPLFDIAQYKPFFSEGIIHPVSSILTKADSNETGFKDTTFVPF